MSLVQTVLAGVKTAIGASGDLVIDFTVDSHSSALDTESNTVVKTTTSIGFVGVYDDFESGNKTGTTAVKDETKIFLLKRDQDDLSVVKPNSEIVDSTGRVLNILKAKPVYAGAQIAALELLVSE